MQITKIKIYSITQQNGVPEFEGQNTMEYNFFHVMKKIEELNKQYDIQHIALPANIIPETYTEEIIVMQRYVERYVSTYKNDFYAADMISYFEFEQNVIWLLRETGTSMVAVNHNMPSQFDKSLIEHHASKSKVIFHVHNGRFKRISLRDALTLINRNQVAV